MRKITLLSNGAILLLFIFGGCGSGERISGATDMPNETKSAIVGTVTSAYDRLPLNAHVSLYRARNFAIPDSDLVDTTHTDRQGTYRFDNVGSGAYFTRSVSVHPVADSVQVAVSNQIVIGIGTTALSSDTGWYSHTIQGYLPLPRTGVLQAWATVLNQPITAVLDSNGQFTLQGVVHSSNMLVILVRGSESSAIVSWSFPQLLNRVESLYPARFSLGNDTVPFLLDNFSDTTKWNNAQGYWWGFADSLLGLHSNYTYSLQSSPGMGDTGHCAALHARIDTTSTWSFAGVGTTIGGMVSGYELAYDFTKIASISFALRGSGNPLSLECTSPTAGVVPLYTITATPQIWTTVTIPIDSAVALMSADQAIRWNTASPYVTRLQWRITRSAGMPDTADLYIDNVEFTFK